MHYAAILFRIVELLISGAPARTFHGLYIRGAGRTIVTAKMSRRRLCACNCGSEVTGDTERRHLSGKGPSSLFYALLTENNLLPNKRHQKPSLRKSRKQRIVGRPATHLHPIPPQFDPCNSNHSPSLSGDRRVPLGTFPDETQEFQMDEAEPFIGNSSTEPPHDDGLPVPRRSTRVMERLNQISKSRWRPGIPQSATNDDEESDEEIDVVDEVYADDNEDDIEEEAEINSELGQRDGALWDVLDEDFLAEAARLGGLMLIVPSKSGLMFSRWKTFGPRRSLLASCICT